MTIWDILGVEPTTDRRTIKRAYADRSKVIHPEEKPEEFQMLYRAYQTALQQAKSAGRKEGVWVPVTEEKKEDAKKKPVLETAGEETADAEELLSYFEEQKRIKAERLAAALEYLKDLWKKFRKPEEKEKLVDYFHSEAFQSIQWHPQVVRLLAEEFPRLSYTQNNEAWQFLWELYGFQEEKAEYDEEVKKFWNILNSARKRWEQDQAEKALYEKNRQAEIKLEKMLQKIRRASCILAAVISPFFIYYCVTADQRYIAEKMAEKYPGIAFSKPKRGEKDEKGTRCYHFRSSAHPDMEITACVKSWTHNAGRRIVIEDYGAQVLGGYAEQYGMRVEAAKEIYQWDFVYEGSGILYYPAGDLEQLGDFCRKAYQMFQEHGELQIPGVVGICMEDALYEEVLLTKGKTEAVLSDEQFFRPWEMTEEELTQKVQEAYIEYMFNYEPWKLTPERYRELGPEYEKMCSRLEGQDKWYDLYVAGERICDLCIRDLPYYARPSEISVGNAYYYLLLQEADVSVAEDGTGFNVQSGEETIHFGEEPYLKFNELEWQFATFDWEIENISDLEIYR